MKKNVVKVGLLGLGTVGSGVMKMLNNNQQALEEKSGYAIEVQKIAVRDLHKKRAVEVSRELLTQNVWEVVNDLEVQVVIEAMGGEDLPRELLATALKAGKHVVCANKDLIAVHGKYLHDIAESNGCELYYEAAVGGAIPIIRALTQSFAADNIQEVMGIVNGTTNFILSKMTAEGANYEDVLKEAQALGYAEADPHADVAGLDAARKMAILSSIAFHKPITLVDVSVEGIEHITPADIQAASEASSVIKLIGRAKRDGDQIEVSVAPTWIPLSHPLAQVNDSFNAVYVHADALGEAMFYGRGAGEMPTASAVVGDLLAVLRGRKFVAKDLEQKLAGVRR